MVLISSIRSRSNYLYNSLSRTKPGFPKRYVFSFAGPRKLDDLIKKELVQDKTGNEVSDIWYSYHEEQENVIGLVLSGECGKNVLTRATECPFFVQPIFREDGYFMLVSQFQKPRHFLMAYLEDYKMDPSSATPLLTFSVFDDYANDKNVSLIRCDVLNKGIEEDEGRKVVQSILENYRREDEFPGVKTFNKKPDKFDFDDYISRMNDRWKDLSGATDV